MTLLGKLSLGVGLLHGSAVVVGMRKVRAGLASPGGSSAPSALFLRASFSCAVATGRENISLFPTSFHTYVAVDAAGRAARCAAGDAAGESSFQEKSF